ncbi:MAG: zinc-ribbon domain-containing protein [Clostridia bacterium]|nr:zinc-ribbon domain-containing protein [Clostridia bacterium]
MSFCEHCGAPIEEGVNFCQVCGEKVNASAAAPEQPGTSGEYRADYSQPAAETTTTANNEVYDNQDIQNNKVLACLSYLGLLFLVPLIAAPDSPYARFHANQGLVLFIAQLICGFVCIIPIVGWIVGAIGEVASVVFMVLGIVNALGGKAQELPVIGKYRILK